MRTSHLWALCIPLLTGSLSPFGAAAQLTPGRWSPEWLSQQTDADTAEVRWLIANVPRTDLENLGAILGRLSRPEAAQLLPSFGYLELSTPIAFMDSLRHRPPTGGKGEVRVGYLLARNRDGALRQLRQTTFAPEFSGHALHVPTLPHPTQGSSDVSIHLSFDFGPADSLLAIVSTPDIPYQAALARISTSAFDAMIQHHSQSFYPVSLSREQLALNLAHAASTQPLDLLYMFARPTAFYNFGDIRRNVSEYRRAFEELRENEAAFASYVSAAIEPYLPSGTRLERRVSLYFGSGSDGWATSTVVAVPFDYYKDDYGRFINTMVHETFHGAQNVVATRYSPPARSLRSAADTALFQAFSQLLVEGTANYIAPTVERSSASADSMSRVGAQLLTELAALRSGTFERSRAQEILNHGVAGGGPFYWTGAAIAARLVQRGGPQAIAQALQSDGVQYVLDYASATANGPESLISPDVLAAARAFTSAH